MQVDMRFAAAAVLAIYGAVAALERVPALQLRKAPLLRPFFATDVGWYLATALVTIAFAPLLAELPRGVQALGLPTLARLDLPLWASVALALVLYDFGAFAAHVMLHRIDGLWSLHKVHHSTRLLDWLATTRAHACEHLFRNIPTQAVLFAIGLPLPAIVLALVVYAGFATLGHSNLRLPLRRLELIFVTPRLHRRHHVPETTERNFGTVFSLWDRAFGSLVVRDTDLHAPLGVPGEESTYPQSWGRQLLEPFRWAVGASNPRTSG